MMAGDRTMAFILGLIIFVGLFGYLDTRIAWGARK